MSAFRAPVPAVTSGQVATFRLSKLPKTGWTRFPYLDVVPSGGIAVTVTPVGLSFINISSAAYVATGTGAGLWVQNSNKVACIDITTGLVIGPELSLPFTGLSGYVGAFIAVGKDIYMSIAGTNRLYKLNTETRVFTRLEDFPRVIGPGSGGLQLPDGRLLFYSSMATGLTITADAIPFWLYSINAGGAPVETTVAIPLTKVATSGTIPRVALLPSGRLLMWDFTNPTSGYRKSCVLTLSGNTLTSSPAEEFVGPTSTGGLGTIPTDTGVVLDTNGGGTGWASYIEGVGWQAVTKPNALGTFYVAGSAAGFGLRAPGYGYVGIPVNNSSNSFWIFLTGTTAHGDPLVQAASD